MTPFQEAQQEALAARLAIDALEAEQKKDKQTLAEMRTAFIAAEQNLADQIARRGETIATARQALQSALQRQNDAPLNTPEETPGVRPDVGDAESDGLPGILTGFGTGVTFAPSRIPNGDGLELTGRE